MLIDSHAHLNFPDFDGRVPEIIAQARGNGVTKIVNIGASMEDSKKAVELAQEYEELFATVGIHPNDDTTITVETADWAEFEELAKRPKVVAIGECGLDYSRITNINDEKRRQKELFGKQIEIARKLDLPLSIHIRDAQIDVVNEFAKILQGGRGVFHCFSGSSEYLKFILDQLPGFYISFAGNVTFKNAKELQELAKLVPLDRLLVETDCPFLSPEPHRGEQNVPANVKMTAQKLADVKGLSLDEISQITSANAAALFGFARPS